MLLVAAFAVGAVMRLAPVLSADFPLNDGGLFYAMIRDLQQAHYSLPLFTSYNATGIPFAYPPLSFYVAGLLNDLTGLSLLNILRILPAIMAALSLGAMYLLARSFHSSEAGVAASVATFALLPESFIWPIMGGGLTRSFGMFFALLGMREAYRLYAEDKPQAVPWLILWSSLAILSHLEWAWLLAVTCGALCIYCCRSRRALLLSVLAALGILLGIAPWLGTVLLHHGWAPFAAALRSGYGTTADAAAGMISLTQVLAIAGVLLLLALRRRRPFFFGWIGVILIFNLRSLFRFSAIPIALATGHLFDSPQARRGTDAAESAPARRPGTMARVLRLGFPVAIAFLTCMEVVLPLMLTKGLGYLVPLAPEERAAMAWIGQSTPELSTFLVASGNAWAVDRSAEWFPVLANRTSVGTVQGTEWLARRAFETAIGAQVQFGLCVHPDSRCLDDWANELGVTFSHVYIPSRPLGACCAELREAMRRDPSYALIYETPGASVFARMAEVRN